MGGAAVTSKHLVGEPFMIWRADRKLKRCPKPLSYRGLLERLIYAGTLRLEPILSSMTSHFHGPPQRTERAERAAARSATGQAGELPSNAWCWC